MIVQGKFLEESISERGKKLLEFIIYSKRGISIYKEKILMVKEM